MESSSPSVTATTTITRFQAFRLQNRGKPWKQAFYLLCFVALIFGYGYLFVTLQPDRSYENVVTWNAALEYRAQQIHAEGVEVKRLRRAQQESDNEQGENRSSAASSVDQIAQFLTFLLTYLTCRSILRRCLNIHERPSVSEGLSWRRGMHGWASDADQAPPMEGNLSRRAHHDLEGLSYLQAAQERIRELEAQQARGAAAEQIDACPVRIVTANDDMLQSRNGDGHSVRCDICLEHYQAGDSIRTIPCFHSFHTDCIDVWLGRRAACPVCMHPL